MKLVQSYCQRRGRKSVLLSVDICCGIADRYWQLAVFPCFLGHHGDLDSGIDVLTATLIPTISITFNTVAYLFRYI